MKLTFFGAAGEVTGSKHVLENGDFKLLLDCGLHQGRRRDAYELNKALPFNAQDIDAAILSHAHADHCGTLPLLVKEGYAGKIHATPVSAAISKLIMLDSAKIQLSDYEHLIAEGQSEESLLRPLYTTDDVEATDDRFVTHEYCRKHAEWNPLNETTRFKFYDAGHILGSAVTVIEGDEAGVKKRVIFTGDLGNGGVPILHDPETVAESADALIIECTYGDRNHRPIEEADNMLAKVIGDAVKNKRKIIVPAFALGRTQEIIYILHRLFNEGRIPALPIYIDSPLSNRITEVFKDFQHDFDTESWNDFMSHAESPFAFDNLHYVTTKEESKALNRMEGPFMIIASSGMAEGGRILHHLEHTVWDENAIIILTGYQAEHTLGRKLLEGRKRVPIFGRDHDLKAEVITINEFSAHADQNGLLKYIASVQNLKQVFLVHGEAPAAEALRTRLAEELPDLMVVIPKPAESFNI